MSFKTMPLRQALETDLLDALSTDYDLFDEYLDTLEIRIYDGDTVLNEFLDLHDLYTEQNIAGIVVNGNLSVHAPIIDFELDTYSCFLLVSGSLDCTRLAAGCAEIIVGGNLTVADVMVAYYNHGTIEIGGDLHATLLIIDDHGASIKGKIDAATFCRGWQIPAADYSSWKSILLPEVAAQLLDEDHYLFAGDVRFLKLLQDGTLIFKPGLRHISANNNPAPQVVGFDSIKPLLQHLPAWYEDYPMALAEKMPERDELKFLLFDGTTVLESLDLDDPAYFGIVVAGDLIVNGNILNENTDGACSLVVLGNLKAKNIIVGGQLIYVTGYVAVQELLMGIYNHGEFTSHSYVWAPVVIADDYRFQFEDFAGVKVLDFNGDDDKEIIKEKVIDELFDQEEWFLYYSVAREGIPLLKPIVQRSVITLQDFSRLLNAPLFGPDHTRVAINEDGWHIALNRGGEIDEDGEQVPSSITAIHTDDEKNFFYYIREDNTVGALVEDEDENWVSAPADMEDEVLKVFSIAENYVNRKITWNNKLKKTIDKDKLWQLIWMFRNTADETVFQGLAIAVFNRVLYAAEYPYAYIFTRYPEESEHRGLADSPYWLTGAALLDGLITAGLAGEITRSVPLSESIDDLNSVLDYYWGVNIQLHERFVKDPIDKLFMCGLNGMLMDRGGALLRLDAGVGSFIIAGMHVKDLDILNELMHPFGVFPKYFTDADEEEEAALKKIAEALKKAEIVALHAARIHQAQLWDYVYNERGDVRYWQEWIDDLKYQLELKGGTAALFRGEEDAPLMEPELDHWLSWCEKYEAISEECNIILE
ncbi:hypothetical protein [Chitinophaga sancti]|uniref:Uncharacterized protein n=1 Tax=Chitinophaga sancti TaxID=1004 RepID=A0A1K1SPE4_9BACT|nr:hypothetical protein [Chitinophaga sancti]WQD64407.1 hypothetical protein U0033_08360 [Chitinophaga sancti]WQG89969.1 hypothetical protein SR876_00560 [Chitinophaga sancti]SFW86193.1 hypothetical protein SAMN05661012_05856 [Chitinophaga sancti]